MGQTPSIPKGAEGVLHPLTRLSTRFPDLETLVFWEAGGWERDPVEIIDAAEAGFYVEGLLQEGFGIDWRLLAGAIGRQTPEVLAIYVWEAGKPPPPDPGPDQVVLQRESWNP